MSRINPSILQPIWPYRANPASPQSRGLEFWVSMSAIPGGNQVYEQGLNKYLGTTSGTANWITGEDNRPALEYPVGIGSHTTFPAPDEPFLGDLTIIWWGSFYNLNTYRHCVSKHVGTGASSNPFDFRTDPFLNSSALVLVRANGGYAYWYTDVRPTAGKFQMLAVTAAAEISTAPAFYVDGIPGSSILYQPGSGTAGGVGEPIWLGRRADAATQTEGYVSEVRIYSRRLSHDEILDQYYNRFDLYWMPWVGEQRAGVIFDIGAAFNARAVAEAGPGVARPLEARINASVLTRVLLSKPIERTGLRLFTAPPQARIYVMPPSESRVFTVPAGNRIYGE